MKESTAAIHPLHMRNTTDFVISGIHNFKQLQGTEKESGIRYIDQLAALLQKNKLVHSTRAGTYSQIYHPQNDQNVAVKIFDTRATNDRNFSILRRYLINDRITDIGFGVMGITKQDIETKKKIDIEKAYMTGQKELEKILENRSYIRFANRKTMPRFEDLDETEIAFLYMAWEHSLYQKLYTPYILPSVFVAYKAPVDILGSEQYDPQNEFHKTIIQRARGRGDEFSKDHFRIICKKGETAYAMVQDYQDLSSIRIDSDFKPANEKQKLQLSGFVKKLELVHSKTGYFPDGTMLESGNLVFNNEGRLVLIDSNHIINRRYSSGADSFALNYNIEKLKEISS